MKILNSVDFERRFDFFYIAQKKNGNKSVKGVPIYFLDQWFILKIHELSDYHMYPTNDPDYTNGLRPEVSLDFISHLLEPIKIQTLIKDPGLPPEIISKFMDKDENNEKKI